MPIEKHITTTELRKLTGLSIKTCACIARKIPGTRKIGCRLLIPEKALEKYFKEHPFPVAMGPGTRPTNETERRRFGAEE